MTAWGPRAATVRGQWKATEAIRAKAAVVTMLAPMLAGLARGGQGLPPTVADTSRTGQSAVSRRLESQARTGAQNTAKAMAYRQRQRASAVFRLPRSVPSTTRVLAPHELGRSSAAAGRSAAIQAAAARTTSRTPQARTSARAVGWSSGRSSGASSPRGGRGR